MEKERSFKFSSVSEFIKFADSCKASQSAIDTVGESRLRKNQKSYSNSVGCENYLQAINHGLKHWPAMPKIEASAIDATASQAFVQSFAGCSVDIGAYLNGEPECFFEFDDVEPNGDLINIEVDVSENWETEPKDIIKKGELALIVNEKLESSNFATSISAECKIKSKKQNLKKGGRKFEFIENYSVQVKEAGNEVSLSQMAFALCHSAFLRVFICTLLESHERFDFFSPSYGRVSPQDLLPESGKVKVPSVYSMRDTGFLYELFNDNKLEQLSEKLIAFSGIKIN